MGQLKVFHIKSKLLVELITLRVFQNKSTPSYIMTEPEVPITLALYLSCFYVRIFLNFFVWEIAK